MKEPDMSIALEIAKKICAMQYNKLPPEAVHWAKVGILDTVGVTILGSRDDSTRKVAKVADFGASGNSLIFGFDRNTDPLTAALINGTAAHALDFDDCNNTLGGHPSVPILPGLFALADQVGATGRDFITAYVAGFETECKISLGVNLHQYMKGWHPTVTVGIFGGAAAAAHLMCLTEEQTATALSIAASMAAGIKSNLGTMTKPLHVGNCTRNALFAAMLAREGFTANPLAFEHKHGYFNVFNGEGNYNIAKILPRWGEPLDIVTPGIAVKQYPCCASTHPAIDAMLELTREHGLTPENVAKIESYTHPRRLEHTNRPNPVSSVDAKFSVYYAVSRALIEQRVVAEHFENDAHRDPKVLSIMARMTAAPYTTSQFPAENHFGAEVRVTLKNGTVLSKKVDQPLGRTSANPLSTAQLKEKFDNCVKGIIHNGNIAPLYETIQEFEKLADTRSMARLISSRLAETREIAA
jgi:2-methylcitrate dehydratase PrpD